VFFPLVSPTADAPVSASGGKPFRNRFAIWNGRIRRVTHAAQQLDGKAINRCSTEVFVFQVEHLAIDNRRDTLQNKENGIWTD